MLKMFGAKQNIYFHIRHSQRFTRFKMITQCESIRYVIIVKIGTNKQKLDRIELSDKFQATD